ncbi:hypothetical protein [Bacteroides sp.]|uniref:hypothetical protein n=1 Tax=Bacteroides sp. TaxID=29523 RepID=UPI002FCC7945
MGKKKYFVILLLLAIVHYTYAQVRMVEGELTTGACISPEQNTSPGAIIGAEIRLNLASGRISPGAQLSQSFFDRKVDGFNQRERYTTFQAVCDYNFSPTSKIMPFVGVGLGLSGIGGDYLIGNDFSPVFIPRIGCEFVKWVRLSADYRWEKYNYSHFTFRVGLVIGGWNKRK